jgi:hypothetical protein
MHYWYVWIAGLIVLPVVAVLPQLKNIHKAIGDGSQSPAEIVRLFLNPWSLVVSIIGVMGTFVCLILFFTSIIFAIISYIKS